MKRGAAHEAVTGAEGECFFINGANGAHVGVDMKIYWPVHWSSIDQRPPPKIRILDIICTHKLPVFPVHINPLMTSWKGLA